MQTFFGIFIEAQPGTTQIYSKKMRARKFDIIFTHKIFVRTQIGADWHSRVAQKKHYATKHGRVPG